MRVGSLFAGIGGFDLGFQRVGFETAWFCENNPYCQEVLKKNWPGVPVYNDVKEIHVTPPIAGEALCRNCVERVDLLCGGFPCQDISLAGRGVGIGGERSGLWGEFARLIREIQPRYVVVENVPAIRSRGLWRVLADLAEIGYDAEWDCLPASAFGAPHQRDRFWLVAYPDSTRRREDPGSSHGDEGSDGGRGSNDDHQSGGTGSQQFQTGQRRGHLADADDPGCSQQRRAGAVRETRDLSERGGGAVADSDSQGRERSGLSGGAQSRRIATLESSGPFSDAELERPQGSGERPEARCGGEAVEFERSDWWQAEPRVGRMVDGVSSRVDRLTALGNALVPQIAEWIGYRIREFELRRLHAG